MSKRIQHFAMKAFNTTGAPTKASSGAVVGAGGSVGELVSNTNFNRVIDVRGIDAISFYVSAGAAGTTSTVTVEVTNDPDGIQGWGPVAKRAIGGGAYNVTALTVTPSTFQSGYFDPADSPTWVRFNVSVNTGNVVITAFILGNL